MNPKEHFSRLQPNAALSSEAARDGLDSALTQALEARPQPRVPDGFALRVVSRLPSQRQPQSVTLATVPRAGRRAAYAALVLLFFAMVVLAEQSRTPGNLAYAVVEYVFAAEFILIAVWMSLRPSGFR